MAQIEQLAEEGARKVLQECLALKRGEAVAIFFDEGTTEAAQALIVAAKGLGLSLRVRQVSAAEQEAFASAEPPELCDEDQEAMHGARGILTCLSASQRGTPYRAKLLRIGTTGDKRLGHMPGADLNILAHAVNIDYGATVARCDNLALALTLGNEATLESYELRPDGSSISYRLQIPLGGMRRYPISSTGVVPLGTWGNVPGGETFIAPIEDLATGSFVLSGSFHGFVLTPPESLILRFDKGRVVQVVGSGSSRRRFDELLESGRALDPINYLALAELGIGVNPGIFSLTGAPLLDEKCAGTAHIALGDSVRYGGKIESSNHEDFVSRSPSLWIDAHPILDHGKDAFREVDWREAIDHVEPIAIELDAPLQRTAVNVEISEEQTLRVRRVVAAGRQCTYTVGNSECTRILATVYGLLPFMPHTRTVSTLRSAAARQGIAEQRFLAALTVLRRHALIK
jgi:leucyl aminopeptidase (aminopeptidase T)